MALELPDAMRNDPFTDADCEKFGVDAPTVPHWTKPNGEATFAIAQTLPLFSGISYGSYGEPPGIKATTARSGGFT